MIAKVLPAPSGETKDLPEHISTHWDEPTLICPESEQHNVTGSSRLIYCHECGKYWKR